MTAWEPGIPTDAERAWGEQAISALCTCPPPADCPMHKRQGQTITMYEHRGGPSLRYGRQIVVLTITPPAGLEPDDYDPNDQSVTVGPAAAEALEAIGWIRPHEETT